MSQQKPPVASYYRHKLTRRADSAQELTHKLTQTYTYTKIVLSSGYKHSVQSIILGQIDI